MIKRYLEKGEIMTFVICESDPECYVAEMIDLHHKSVFPFP